MSARSAVVATVVAGLVGVAVAPSVDRLLERRRQAERLERIAARSVDLGRVETTDLATRVARLAPVLASWQDVGGCGVGGAPGVAGGRVKWIGRSVTGGRVDFECITSAAFVDNGQTLTVNFRPSTELANKWILGADLPFLIKLQEVAVNESERHATLAGLGDPSFDVTYKLGLANASRVTLSLTVPVCPNSSRRTSSCLAGAYDAVRQGVILPQQAQLGTGQLAAALTFERTFDELWGMILVGGNLATPVAGRTGPSADFVADPERARTGANSVGDYRASSVSAYAYVGYLWGPFVPHAGFTLNGRYEKDRERFEVLERQSLLTGTLHLGLEWASDYVALLLAANMAVSLDELADNGVESWTLAFGATTSLF